MLRFVAFFFLELLFAPVFHVNGFSKHGNISASSDGTGFADLWRELYKLREENLDIQRNQTSIHQNYITLQAQMAAMKTKNEELQKNQTILTRVYETRINQQQSVISGLQSELSSLTKTFNAVQTVSTADVKLNSTMQALQTVHRATAAIVTSLQGKQQALQKQLDTNISHIVSNLTVLRGTVTVGLSSSNESFIQLDRHIESIKSEINKNVHGNSF